jgi:hypothetical protein
MAKGPRTYYRRCSAWHEPATGSGCKPRIDRCNHSGERLAQICRDRFCACVLRTHAAISYPLLSDDVAGHDAGFPIEQPHDRLGARCALRSYSENAWPFAHHANHTHGCAKISIWIVVAARLTSRNAAARHIPIATLETRHKAHNTARAVRHSIGSAATM